MVRRAKNKRSVKQLAYSKRKHNSSTYRSGLEDRVSEQLKGEKIEFRYEPLDGKIEYTIPSAKHVYTPDFYITTRTGKTIIIETKGIWAYDDRYKHLLLKQQHPRLDIRFVFSNSRSRISKGSVGRYDDICEGRGRGIFKGVTWKYSDKLIPKEWFDE